MEIPANLQALLEDICVGNCGHFNKALLISTKIKLWTNYVTICEIYCIIGQEAGNLIYKKTFMLQYQPA